MEGLVKPFKIVDHGATLQKSVKADDLGNAIGQGYIEIQHGYKTMGSYISIDMGYNGLQIISNAYHHDEFIYRCKNQQGIWGVWRKFQTLVLPLDPL